MTIHSGVCDYSSEMIRVSMGELFDSPLDHRIHSQNLDIITGLEIDSDIAAAAFEDGNMRDLSLVDRFDEIAIASTLIPAERMLGRFALTLGAVRAPNEIATEKIDVGRFRLGTDEAYAAFLATRVLTDRISLESIRLVQSAILASGHTEVQDRGRFDEYQPTSPMERIVRFVRIAGNYKDPRVWFDDQWRGARKQTADGHTISYVDWLFSLKDKQKIIKNCLKAIEVDVDECFYGKSIERLDELADYTERKLYELHDDKDNPERKLFEATVNPVTAKLFQKIKDLSPADHAGTWQAFDPDKGSKEEITIAPVWGMSTATIEAAGIANGDFTEQIAHLINIKRIGGNRIIENTFYGVVPISGRVLKFRDTHMHQKNDDLITEEATVRSIFEHEQEALFGDRELSAAISRTESVSIEDQEKLFTYLAKLKKYPNVLYKTPWPKQRIAGLRTHQHPRDLC